MLRSEVEEKTGLSRKAIEYYEDKGLIYSQRLENGYRDYSDEDVKLLKEIALLTKLGLSLGQVKDILLKKPSSLSSILRAKEYDLEVEEKKKEILDLLLKGADQALIEEKIKALESQKTLYERLTDIFPGYFGQLLFAAYKPFLNEPLDPDREIYFKEFVAYLDRLPSFTLSKEEEAYLEELSKEYTMESFDEINQRKIEAVYDSERWLEENKDLIETYEAYKNSQAYKHSQIKVVQDKLKDFMITNNYYDIAIPLIRKLSKSYDAYYEKLLAVNENYLQKKN